MPKLQDFRVDFDKPNAIYAPGEIVAGRVLLKLSSSKNVREIRLEARGEAGVHWKKQMTTKVGSGLSRYQTVHYNANEQYFNFTFTLVGSAQGSTTIPAGENVYNFTFKLPPDIPCSMENALGHVRYTIKAVLDRPWRFDQKVFAAFTVIRSHDLNQLPNLIGCIADDIHRPFKYFCIIDFGEITLKIKTPKKGYVPGETIDLNISYDNNSSRVQITKIKANIEQSFTFHARSPWPEKKIKSQIIVKKKTETISNQKGETTLPLEIPSVPPSNLEACSIIDLKYTLHVNVHLSGAYSKIVRQYPLEIGTVPVMDRPQNSGPHSIPTITPSAPSVDEVGTVPAYPPTSPPPVGFVIMSIPPYVNNNAQNTFSLPPPSYEECVSGSNHIVDQNSQGLFGSNTPFTPRYPVYKFPTPYPPVQS